MTVWLDKAKKPYFLCLVVITVDRTITIVALAAASKLAIDTITPAPAALAHILSKGSAVGCDVRHIHQQQWVVTVRHARVALEAPLVNVLVKHICNELWHSVLQLQVDGLDTSDIKDGARLWPSAAWILRHGHVRPQLVGVADDRDRGQRSDGAKSGNLVRRHSGRLVNDVMETQASWVLCAVADVVSAGTLQRFIVLCTLDSALHAGS
eukprot:27708-Chlamydomonas_euryale.AAC.11